MGLDSTFLEKTGSFQISRIVIGKLKIGVDLLEGVKELVIKEGIRSGVFLSGLGALQKAVFRNPKVMPADFKMRDEYRLFVEINRPLEMVSFPGWIATRENGEPEIHAHFTASTVMNDQIVTLGGHLIPGTITSIKCAVIIGVIEDSRIKAALDPNVNQMEIFF
ncbi:MAG: DNA-binding protein [Deltaproteobacteria bacterium]|nr:MAG: DNA-binding protein [Deltaproteobacteria bacterium]